MWLRSEQIDEMFTQSLNQSQCAQESQCLSWHQGFFTTLTWGTIMPQSLNLPLQTKIFRPPQSEVLWTKERD